MSSTDTTGSRSFNGGMVITWTPSTTTNSVSISISIGGDEAWTQDVSGDTVVEVKASGDNYSLAGSLNVTFSGDGGQFSGDLKWTLQGSDHSYDGLIGSW